ncbi:MAG TPA: glutamate synthase large subunit, partial [Gemmatimonadaceae bacterium]|nr:glutamate synthase large subunit [Gemmatimonadaceae bacterium]
MRSDSREHGHPAAQGLYDPRFEHDACGVGFVAHIGGTRSHDVVRDALALLERLAHRSAVGADPETGDGAGILLQLPHAYLRRVAHGDGIPLPEAGAYGVGMLFLPRDADARATCARLVEHVVADEGCAVLGWRDVATDESRIGEQARASAPVVRQVFIARRGLGRDLDDANAFERQLYLVRRRIERAVHDAGITPGAFHAASFSSRTIVYKGMLRPQQLRRFYPELRDEELASALAVVHSRFSTNTFPSWPLAQPFRHLCHNGEINTIRGNVHWMGVRERTMRAPTLGDRTAELFPLIGEGQSDSASVDNVLELLVAAGRPIEHAMAMLVPEAWENEVDMPPERRAFYEFHATLLEPWDGPAALVFTDGRVIGATLDRNGLRPARYVVTTDERLILASEAGALALPPERIRAKGHLEAGRMLLVNTVQGRLLDDEAVKADLAGRRTYRRWLDERRVVLRDQPAAVEEVPEPRALARQQRAFGYTAEELRMVLAPMATTGEEPIGSMGNDAPLAVLSERPQLLFSYFRQLFAQVTNPAIDPIRESLVMSLATMLGPEGNLLEEVPEHAARIRLEAPVLDASGMAQLRAAASERLGIATVHTLFEAARGPEALEGALAELCRAAQGLASCGCGILVLSDRGTDATHAAIPALLAASTVHQHLVEAGLRGRVGLVVETAEARDVAQVALLLGYGVGAVHPYLALDTVAALAREGMLGPLTAATAQARYRKALHKGLLKILSKLGISTLQSYCGARSFEAVGLDHGLVRRHFAGTVSRLGGIQLDDVARETLARHAAAYDLRAADVRLDEGSTFHYRNAGEHHQWNPLTIASLQRAVREDRPQDFEEFSRRVGEESRRTTLRGMLGLAEATPVPLDEVEPATAIARRFVTGAMSFGSLSAEAHETLALAMNRLGGRSNTGEGGEDRARFGTPRNSAIKQVASARFGVTTEYLVNAVELQIKIAQGAKPGEGGQLPGHKVDEVIAHTRHATAGVTLISPPPHHDIYSIEDLAQLIHDLRAVNPTA